MLKKGSTATSPSDIAVDVRSVVKVFTQSQRENAGNGVLKRLARPEKKRVYALDNVTFQIRRGEFVAYAGPNGAGKSTVLNILSRLIARDSGLVDFEGQDISHWKSKELAKRLAILTQSNNIQMKLTVQELVTFGRFPYSGNHVTGEDMAIVERAIQYMELDPFRDRFIDELSGGQRQRALIAMVIAQDTTYYGLDLYGKRRLAELLEALCRIDGIRWIRLHYAYPTAFPDEVIEVMAREPKICKYLDIPFQHISDDQLAAMHRRHTKAQAYELIDKLRQAIPDLALRTTLLVGYPGETEADFEELLEFVRTVRFERLGVFPYSEEEGTYSARNLPDDVPEEVKQSRVERVMALQNEISLENNRARIGQLERVIIDSRQGDFYVGRSQYDSPEVDQEILIPASEKRLLRGRFYDVRIDSAADYDLYGRAAGK